MSSIINETQYVTEVYNKIGVHFDITRVNKWSWITEFIVNLNPNSYILDNGCGNGRNMLYPYHTFIGLDSSKIFIDICKKKGLNCEIGDMCKLPYSNNQFDAILSIAVFHHLSTIERRIQALKEMYRILKPNGKLLLSVWSIIQPKKTRRVFTQYGDTIVPWKNIDETYERYYYIFEISEICSLFEKIGFNIESHIWDTGNEIFCLTKKNNRFV